MAGFAGDNAMFPSIEEVPLIVGWHGIEGLTGTSRADPRCMCSPGGDTLLHSLVDQGAEEAGLSGMYLVVGANGCRAGSRGCPASVCCIWSPVKSTGAELEERRRRASRLITSMWTTPPPRSVSWQFNFDGRTP